MDARGATIARRGGARPAGAGSGMARRLVTVPLHLAATLAFAAEGIHLSVLPDQYQVWWGYGLFYLVVAMAQGILGVSLLFGDPGPTTLRLGILLNLAVVLVWAFTRVGGVPIWNRFTTLPVGDVDLAATIVELALVLLLAILGRLHGGRTVVGKATP